MLLKLCSKCLFTVAAQAVVNIEANMFFLHVHANFVANVAIHVLVKVVVNVNAYAVVNLDVDVVW